MTVEDLEKGLKQGILNNIYLFYGEEVYLLENAVRKIKKTFGNLVLGINYIQINEDNIRNLISDIETPALGFDKKLIIIKNSNLLSKEQNLGKSNNNDLQKEIAEYIQKNINTIKSTVILVFIEENFLKNDLAKTIEENGVVCNFRKLKPIDIKRRIKSICTAYKVNIDEANLQLLIETCGVDMQSLINEIRKLIEYAGENGTITQESINKLSTKEFGARIFDLTDNLGKRDIAKALEILNELLYNREPIQKILITLYNHFRKLYFTKLCLGYARNIPETLNLKANQMFLVSKYKEQSKYYTKDELRKLLAELIELDKRYKIGLIDINVGLEAILCAYL